MPDLHPHDAPRSLRGARRGLGVFIAAGLLTLIGISLGTVVASRHVAEADALGDAERSADRTVAVVIGPLLTEAMDGVPGARERLDQEVDSRLAEGSVVEIAVWSADGTIVYAGHSENIGRRLPLPDDARAAIENRARHANFDDAPETGAVPGVSRVVEVVVPLQLAGQPPLALEVYYDFARVDRQIRDLEARIVPMAVLALLALQLVQVPIAVGLVRLVRRHVNDRAALLERALSASDAERRAVAADLHDGAVQDLHGAVFALTALRPSIDPAVRPVAQRVIETLTSAAHSLRRLIIDIYPPDLTGPGLPGALDELAEPLRRSGVTVRLDVAPLPPMERDIAAALYRVAREALANVAKHACAENVLVELAPDPSARGVCLRVIDDGIGLAPDALERVPRGHLGLRLLHDRVADLGGELTLAAGATGRGTVADLRLPLGLDADLPARDARPLAGT
jgi:two-component system NarL family sensor kinase